MDIILLSTVRISWIVFALFPGGLLSSRWDIESHTSAEWGGARTADTDRIWCCDRSCRSGKKKKKNPAHS